MNENKDFFWQEEERPEVSGEELETRERTAETPMEAVPEISPDVRETVDDAEEDAFFCGSSRGTGAGRKESPFADSPYVMNRRPEQTEYHPGFTFTPPEQPPKKPRKAKKARKSGVGRKLLSAALAIALVVILAVSVAVCFLPKNTAAPVQAEIYQDGNLLKTVSLEEETSFAVTGKYTNTITVEDGRIAITASDCPGEDCVHSGGIHTTGRSIVCLPNGVEVRVVNAASDVDFVVG